MYNQVLGSIILTSLFGIPHGAIDNIIFLSRNKLSSNKFYLVYVISILIYCFFWYLWPTYSFIFFLALSAYHFGESQLSDYSSFNIHKTFLYIIWGIFLISSLVYYNIDELIRLSNESEDMIQFIKVFERVIFQYIFYCSNLFLLTVLSFERLKSSISTQEFMSEIFQIILIHITFILFPVIISFTLYFTFLHSLKVLKQEYNYLKSLITNLDLFKFFKLLIPHTLIAFVFLIIFVLLINLGFIKISLFLFSIIAISVITLPHAIIMSNFYNKK